AVRIPDVKDRLGLSTGQLGISLLALTVSLILAMPLVSWLLTRFESRAIARATAFAFVVVPVLPVLAVDQATLMLGLAFYGVTASMLDVAINIQGTDVEARMRRPAMSSFHGLYSVGGIAGSAIGGGLAALGISPRLHLFIVALFMGIFGGYIAGWLLPESPVKDDRGPMFARPTRLLAVLGIVAFCAVLNEGAMSDWSAVYLRDAIGTSAGLAAVGFTVFSITMTAGRLTGDRLAMRFGSSRLIRIGGALSALGLGLSLLFPSLPATLVGFACVGAGMSFVFPLVVSAASRSGRIAPGPAIAAISTAAYVGLVAGPSSIGLTSDLFSLRVALGIVVMLCLVVAVLARHVSDVRSLG
ncbi:MAG TPA: MFS transporter, partial [Nitrolancea sp.]|nr:MFS transporter [Nitrolancea sp.]